MGVDILIPFCHIGLIVFGVIEVTLIGADIKPVPRVFLRIVLGETDDRRRLAGTAFIDADPRILVLFKVDCPQHHAVRQHDLEIRLTLLRKIGHGRI